LVHLPQQPPSHPYLEALEPLGWIHTQPNELPQLAPQDCATQAQLIKSKDWKVNSSIILTCSFTPGSVSLTAYQLTSAGVDWGSKAKDPLHNPTGYSAAFAHRFPLLLSDRFLGFYLIPDGIEWNYNFQGARWNSQLNYTLKLGQPKEFYHANHRPQHFLKFVQMGDIAEEGML